MFLPEQHSEMRETQIFNSFSACAGMGALGRTVSVLHNKIAFTDENSIFILSLLLAGTFTYSLGRNALNDSLY